MNNGTCLNSLPSNNPLSLNFNSGITSNAMNESVINGADICDPYDFTRSDNFSYFDAIFVTGSSDIIPSTGSGISLWTLVYPALCLAILRDLMYRRGLYVQAATYGVRSLLHRPWGRPRWEWGRCLASLLRAALSPLARA